MPVFLNTGKILSPGQRVLAVSGFGEVVLCFAQVTAACSVCVFTRPLRYSLLLQAYAMMLSLSENAPLHTSSQNSLGAWLDMAGAASESGTFNPINHL